MKRKVLAGVLSLSMVLSAAPMTAFAEGEAAGNTSQIEVQSNEQEESSAADVTDASQEQNADAQDQDTDDSENEENQQEAEGEVQENQKEDAQAEAAESAYSESEAANQVATYSAETQVEGVPADAVHIDNSNAENIGAGTYYYDAVSANTAKQIQINGGTKENPAIIYISGEIRVNSTNDWIWIKSGYVKLIGVNNSKVEFSASDTDYAIYMDYPDTVIMENLDIHNTTGYGISRSKSTLVIKDCKFISYTTALNHNGKLYIDGNSEFESTYKYSTAVSISSNGQMYLLKGTIKGCIPLGSTGGNIYLLGGKLISTNIEGPHIEISVYNPLSTRLNVGDTEFETANGMQKWIRIYGTQKVLHFMKKGETIQYSIDGENYTYIDSKDLDETIFIDDNNNNVFTFADGSLSDRTIKEDKGLLYHLAVYGNRPVSIGWKDGEIYFYKHTHNFTLSKGSDGKTITAKCISTDSGKSQCNFQNDADFKFVLDAKDSDTPGTTYDGLNVTDNITALTGKTVSYTYYLDENLTTKTTSANSGAAKEGAAPVNAGTYWVAATMDNLTVKDSFTIKSPKVEGTVEAAQDQITYNSTAQTLVKGESAEGTIYYRLGADGEWSTTAPTAKDAGTYTVYYYITANSGDESENNGSAEEPAGSVDVTIAKKTVTVSSVKANDKTYDGTTDAALDFSEVKIDGVVAGDTVTADAKGTFNSKNIKDADTVTISDWTLGGDSAGNYEISAADSQETVEASINPKAVELKWSDSNLTYKDAPYTMTAEVTNKASDDDTFALIYADNSKTEVGDYTAKVTGLGNDNYTLDRAENVTKSWSISYLETKAEASVTTEPDGTNGWYRTGVTVKPADGYQISEDGKTWKDSLSYKEDGTFTKGYYLKDADGYITGEKEISFKIDQTAPTGSIKVGENIFDKLLNKITFGHFFKDYVEAAINGTDAVSGIAKVEYQKVAKDSTFDENGEWTTGDSVKMTANDKSVIYVRLTDEAGNQSIINSDGIVVYTDASKETEDVTYTRTSTDDVTTDINTNGNTVKEIRLGETVLDASAYEVNAEGYLVLKNAYLSQLAAGNYELTVSYNPYGEAYVEAADDQAPKTTKVQLSVVKAEGTVTNIQDISATYTGSPITAPTFDASADKDKVSVTYEYKLKDSDDATYTTEAPVKAGTYVVRITVGSDENYEAVSVTKEFTIAPAKVTVKVKDASSIFSKEDAKLDFEAEGVIDGTPLTGIRLSRVEGENAGTYDIIAGQEEGSNPNYDITFEKGTYTIEPFTLENLKVSLENTLAYNGKEQEQLVKSVALENGTVIPEDGYVVEGNKATEPGVYTLTVKGTGNYTGEVRVTYVIAPTKTEQVKEDTTGKVEIGNGTLNIEVKSEENAPKTSLVTGKAELIDMLVKSGDITADELAQIANGARADFVVTVKDASSTVSNEAKKAMTDTASKAGYTIGQYFDISLYKYITVDGVTDEGVQLHSTTDKVKISVQIPENLLNKDSKVERTYYIVRYHDGKAEIIEGTYDEKTQTFTFATDKFSDYAIAYKDVKKADAAGTTTGTNSTAKTTKTVKTGDTANVFGYMIAFAGAFAVMLGGFVSRRKRTNK